MKRILLLAAIHALIINQYNKDAKGKLFSGAQKKTFPKNISSSQEPAQFTDPSNRDYANVVFLSADSSRRPHRLSMRQ